MTQRSTSRGRNLESTMNHLSEGKVQADKFYSILTTKVPSNIVVGVE